MAIHKILCPVDFSEASRHAIGYASALARSASATLVGLHVEEPMLVPATVGPPVGDVAQPAAPARSDLVHRLGRQFANGTPASPLVVDVAAGKPANAIAQYATACAGDLIVIGTRGAGGLRHFLLGSVTEEVIRLSTVPVLSIPPQAAPAPSLPFGNVLFATDFSAASLAALTAALRIVSDEATAVTILHVIDDPDENELFVARPYDVHRHAAEREASVRACLDDVVCSRFEGRVAPTVRIVHGRPPHEILRVAAEMAADLLVMGVHGRNAIDTAIFGSTTNQVVRRSSCPVLTARS
jgi:nucleotide-binding universal stress UspA family protein